MRVVEYTFDDGRDNQEHYRLVATMLDPDQAPGGTTSARAASRRRNLDSPLRGAANADEH